MLSGGAKLLYSRLRPVGHSRGIKRPLVVETRDAVFIAPRRHVRQVKTRWRSLRAKTGRKPTYTQNSAAPGAVKIPLELIEVHSGSYLGEDDIERFDDVRSRQND
jgi:hypothetical protein